MKNRIRIILADDHSVLRAGLKMLLESESHFSVVGEAADGEELLILINRGIFEHETVDIPAGYTQALMTLWSDVPGPGPFTMEPLSALVLKKQRQNPPDSRTSPEKVQ